MTEIEGKDEVEHTDSEEMNAAFKNHENNMCHITKFLLYLHH